MKCHTRKCSKDVLPELTVCIDHATGDALAMNIRQLAKSRDALAERLRRIGEFVEFVALQPCIRTHDGDCDCSQTDACITEWCWHCHARALLSDEPTPREDWSEAYEKSTPVKWVPGKGFVDDEPTSRREGSEMSGEKLFHIREKHKGMPIEAMDIGDIVTFVDKPDYEYKEGIVLSITLYRSALYSGAILTVKDASNKLHNISFSNVGEVTHRKVDDNDN